MTHRERFEWLVIALGLVGAALVYVGGVW